MVGVHGRDQPLEGSPTAAMAVVGLDADDETDTEVLALAAALERQSEHPLAGGIGRAAESRGVALDEPKDFEVFPGKGLLAASSRTWVVHGWLQRGRHAAGGHRLAAAHRRRRRAIAPRCGRHAERLATAPELPRRDVIGEEGAACSRLFGELR